MKNYKSAILIYSISIIILFANGCKTPIETVSPESSMTEETPIISQSSTPTIIPTPTTAMRAYEGFASLNVIVPSYITIGSGYIYYLNYKDGATIYRRTLDGTENIKLNEDQSSHIIIVDDCINYVNNSQGYSLYKMNLDGTQQIKVLDEPITQVVIHGWIYYKPYPNRGLCRIKTDGSEKYEFNVDIPIEKFSLSDSGDWIIFTEHNEVSLYKIKTDGSQLTKIHDGKVSDFKISGNQIYFTDAEERNKLYKINMDGTGLEQVHNIYSRHFDISDEWIYYSNLNDFGKLYKIGTDGTGNIKLSDDTCANIEIIGDRIFYHNLNQNSLKYLMNTDGSERALIEKLPDSFDMSTYTPKGTLIERGTTDFELIMEKYEMAYKIEATFNFGMFKRRSDLVKEYEGIKYYKVDEPDFSSLDEYNMYINKLFMEDLRKRYKGSFKDFDGQLYMMDDVGGRGSAIDAGEDVLYVSKISDDRILVTIYLESIEHDSGTPFVKSIKTHEFFLIPLDGEWLFENFYSIR